MDLREADEERNLFNYETFVLCLKMRMKELSIVYSIVVRFNYMAQGVETDQHHFLDVLRHRKTSLAAY